MTDLKRYDLFGWDYAAYSPLDEAEVAWHVDWAQRTGGPLLGLACGTGRLLCRLADAGFDVTGLDLAEGMLARARRNAAALPLEVQARIRLVRGDMSNFALGRRFGLTFIADNSFRELRTRKALLACLRGVRRHLRPQGRLLVTERRFNPALFHNGRRSFGWSEPQPHPETGLMVSRRGEFSLDKNSRRMRGKFVYRTTWPNGEERIEACPISAPILSRDEYVALFRRAGFETQVFCGYQQAPDDGKATILCFVCE